MKKNIEELTVHPFNLEIYGEPDTDLQESIANHGLTYPIDIDPNGRILSGARRWAAARAIGLSEIDVRVRSITGDDAQTLILLANDYREKTPWVRKKEADAFVALIERNQKMREEIAAHIEQRDGKPPSPADLRPRRLAAKAAKLAPTTYDQTAYVADEDRGEQEITAARDKGLISTSQASSLKRQIRSDRNALKEDTITPTRAAKKARDRLRQAQVKKAYPTEEARKRREALDQAHRAMRQSKALLKTLGFMQRTGLGSLVGARHLFVLHGSLFEARQLLEAMARDGGIPLPANIDDVTDIEEADVEIIE